MSRRLLGGAELEGYSSLGWRFFWGTWLTSAAGGFSSKHQDPLTLWGTAVAPAPLPVLEPRHVRWGIDVFWERRRDFSLQRMTQQDHFGPLSLVLEPLKLTPPSLKISSTASLALIASNQRWNYAPINGTLDLDWTRCLCCVHWPKKEQLLSIRVLTGKLRGLDLRVSFLFALPFWPCATGFVFFDWQLLSD